MTPEQIEKEKNVVVVILTMIFTVVSLYATYHAGYNDALVDMMTICDRKAETLSIDQKTVCMAAKVFNHDQK